jgi:hypothetical protein
MAFKRNMKAVLKLGGAMVLVGSGFLAGRGVPVTAQWPAFDGLRVTAAIVFGVIGIWFAVLYPQLLQRLAGWRQPVERQTGRLIQLSAPLVDSAAVVAVVSLVSLARPVLAQVHLPADAIALCRGASFGLLVALTLVQLRALVGAIVPIFRLRDQLAEDEERARVRSRFAEPQPSAAPAEEPVGAGQR